MRHVPTGPFLQYTGVSRHSGRLKQEVTEMKKKHASLISLMALALVVGSGVKDAKAEFKVTATLTTPNVRVHVRSTPTSPYRSYTTRYMPPARVITYYRPNPQDRAIAIRLAQYTGVTTRELIGMKRQGYTWVQIGRWLDLPHNAVRAARNGRTWQQFLRNQRKVVKRKVRGMKHGWNQKAFGSSDFMDTDDVDFINANEVIYEDD